MPVRSGDFIAKTWLLSNKMHDSASGNEILVIKNSGIDDAAEGECGPEWYKSEAFGWYKSLARSGGAPPTMAGLF